MVLVAGDPGVDGGPRSTVRGNAGLVTLLAAVRIAPAVVGRIVVTPTSQIKPRMQLGRVLEEQANELNPTVTRGVRVRLSMTV